MQIQLHDGLKLFRDYWIGKQIRKQPVAGVELTIDDETDDGSFRYFLIVHFRANEPAEDISPEEKMLQRVFNEAPKYARILIRDVDELRARLVGLKPCHEHEWLLDDEIL